MHDFPGLKPTCSLIRCDSTIGVILFRMSTCFASSVHMCSRSKMFELFYQYVIYACCLIILECRNSFPVFFLGEWINK